MKKPKVKKPLDVEVQMIWSSPFPDALKKFRFTVFFDNSGPIGKGMAVGCHEKAFYSSRSTAIRGAKRFCKSLGFDCKITH